MCILLTPEEVIPSAYWTIPCYLELFLATLSQIFYFLWILVDLCFGKWFQFSCFLHQTLILLCWDDFTIDTGVQNKYPDFINYVMINFMKFVTLLLRKNTSCIFSFKIECKILEPSASFIQLYLWALCAIAIQPWNVKGKFCSRWKFQDQCGPHLYWNQFEKFMKLPELKGPIMWNWVVPHVKLVDKNDEIFWKVHEIGKHILVDLVGRVMN